MDLLKLKLNRTDNTVGNGWRSYEVEGGLAGVEAVLVKSVDGYPQTLDIMILEEPSAVEQTVCTAKILDIGMNKISMIKAVREVTNWGLKESKDWVESIPHDITPRDGFSRQSLIKLVEGIRNAGGKDRMYYVGLCGKVLDHSPDNEHDRITFLTRLGTIDSTLRQKERDRICPKCLEVFNDRNTGVGSTKTK
jgi:ribosomal protein L7/L12